MHKKTKKDTAPNKTSRRKFITGALAAGGAAAVGAVAMPNVARAQTAVLKVQAAWGGGIFLEFAKDYVTRVNKMAGGSMKIDLLSVGAVVKTAEMQTAVHKGVLDGAHLVTAYWYSKSPVASLFGTHVDANLLDVVGDREYFSEHVGRRDVRPFQRRLRRNRWAARQEGHLRRDHTGQQALSVRHLFREPFPLYH